MTQAGTKFSRRLKYCFRSIEMFYNFFFLTKLFQKRKNQHLINLYKFCAFLKSKFKKKPEIFIFCAILMILPTIEIKKIKRGRKMYSVPKIIFFKRQLFLTTKNIKISILKRSEKKFFNRFKAEIFDITQKKICLSFEFFFELYDAAIENRMFSHYRW